MKQSISLICLTITIQMAIAQKGTCMAGVFLTYNDFVKKYLSCKTNTNVKGNSLGFIPYHIL